MKLSVIGYGNGSCGSTRLLLHDDMAAALTNLNKAMLRKDVAYLTAGEDP
jgi:hypothetical protein